MHWAIYHHGAFSRQTLTKQYGSAIKPVYGASGIAVKLFGGGFFMKIRKKILDYEYEEVLDTKTRELIRVGCAIAVGCPT